MLDLFSDELLFLSLCFYHCTKMREWMLSNDRSLVGGCYFHATELLFDNEILVRRAALRVFQVSEWGQLLVALNPDESKIYWSDALFLQSAGGVFLKMYLQFYINENGDKVTPQRRSRHRGRPHN